MARIKITPELIIKINELYCKIGTYAGVSRELGGSPSATTVKKYIIKDYIPLDKQKPKKIFTEKCLRPVDIEIFKNLKNWGNLCILSEEEFKEEKELWNELTI